MKRRLFWQVFGYSISIFVAMLFLVSLILSIQTSPISRLLLLLLAASGIAALSSHLFSRLLARPLVGMSKNANDYGKGNLAGRIDNSDTVEIDDLAVALNQMAERLEARIRSLESQRGEQEAVLAGMIEGILAVDSDERLININRVAASMLDIGEQAGAGKYRN